MAASMHTHASSTLFVRNLPYSATKDDLESVFGEIGPLKQCFVVTDKGVKDKCRGFGYVTYALRDDAEKAVQSPHSLVGRKLKVAYANKKPGRGTVRETYTGPIPVKTEKETHSSPKAVTSDPKASATKTKQKEKKKKKKKKVKGEVLNVSEREKRKSRLIIRNLPFKCTEEKLKTIFATFGTVTEVTVPMKEKKSLGFGFVQFEKLKEAGKALRQMNGKQIMNRAVAVDWTIPRSEYLEAMQKRNGSLESDKHGDDGGSDVDSDEEGDGDEEEDKEDEDEETTTSDEDQKSMEVEEEDENSISEEEEDEEEEDVKMDDEDDDEDEEEDGDDEDDDDEEEDEDEEEDDDGEDEIKVKQGTKHQSTRKPSEDVQEGKTLFIRNIPYDSTDDDVRELFAPFGELEFAKVVVDPMTEHSRGTAFVKFKRKEDADGCLREGDAVRLSGRLLAISRAISRAEAVKLRTAEKDKAKEEQKDKRNLHLLREGLIRPGTKAAEGLSEQYMNKRMKIENVKKEKLKNLNIFVSPTRLGVHNLPKAVDDKKLRELVRTAAGDKKAKVIEARIMRDVNNPSATGVSKSLGFGFVEFTEYEHALAALLHLNNNATVFGPEKRPIVGFSLENRRALEIQQKRREKMMMKRQVLNKKPYEDDNDDAKKEESKPRKPYSQQRLQAQQKTGVEPHQPASTSMVMPVDGKKKGLPRHFGAKNRWRDKGKVAEEKRKRRKEKRMVLQKQVWKSMKAPEPAGGLKIDKKELRKELRKEKQKNSRRKQNRDVREDLQFNAKVNKYKQKLTRGSNSRNPKGATKWFDT